MKVCFHLCPRKLYNIPITDPKNKTLNQMPSSFTPATMLKIWV